MPWRLSLKLGVEAPNPPTTLLPGRKSASNMAVLRSWGTPNKSHRDCKPGSLCILLGLYHLNGNKERNNLSAPVSISNPPHMLGTL